MLGRLLVGVYFGCKGTDSHCKGPRQEEGCRSFGRCDVLRWDWRSLCVWVPGGWEGSKTWVGYLLLDDADEPVMEPLAVW